MKSSVLFICLFYFFLFPILFGKLYAENIQKKINLDYYIKNLKDKNEAVRIKVLNELSIIKDKEIVSILKIPLNDKNFFIRKKAALILGNLPFKNSVSILIQKLRSESDIFVKKSIIQSLGNLKDNRAFFILKRYTKDKELILNMAAKEALKKLQSWRKKIK